MSLKDRRAAADVARVSGRPTIATTRTRGLLLVLLVLTLGLAGGWAMAGKFESPQQRQAKAQPPAPEKLWFPVRQGRLADQASGRGTVEPSSVEKVQLQTLPPNGVVTRQTIVRGETVYEMNVVTEINGQPVFVTTGAFPYYRDLAPKDAGPDVEQLQRALMTTGHAISSTEFGTYGSDTVAAVEEEYRESGYPVSRSIPLTSLTVVATLPEQVLSSVPVGTALSEGAPLVTLGHGGAVASAEMEAGAVSRMRIGMSARIYAGGQLISRARVSSLPRGTERSTVQVTPTSALDPGDLGRRVVVVVDIKVISKRSLLVPATAVVIDGDGNATVLSRFARGDEARVAVDLLGELAGVAAISPLHEDEVSAAAEVKVG